jgi:hypothetical protein
LPLIKGAAQVFWFWIVDCEDERRYPCQKAGKEYQTLPTSSHGRSLA